MASTEGVVAPSSLTTYSIKHHTPHSLTNALFVRRSQERLFGLHRRQLRDRPGPDGAREQHGLGKYVQQDQVPRREKGLGRSFQQFGGGVAGVLEQKLRVEPDGEPSAGRVGRERHFRTDAVCHQKLLGVGAGESAL